ncbi:MAG: acyl-CoA dehydrogenase family protein [Alphaproteobacteria bacterium]
MPLEPDMREALVSSVRRFVAERLEPLEAEVALCDEVPEGVVADMRRLGLFGLSIPAEYGGLGLSMEEEVQVVFELGRTSPAFRSVVGTNVGIGSGGIVMFGTEAQKREWLPRLASGEIIASFCLTEPEAGSDAASLKTTAARDGMDYVLNGTKRFITNADRAGLFTVMARTAREKGASGISSFLVPAHLPGIRLGTPERKMGQHGAQVCDVAFENCRVPASSLLGIEGEGFKNAMKILDRGRIHISAVCVGVAERLIEECVTYARERRQFGKPIGEFQLVQAMIADSCTEAYAARSMVVDAARRRDAGAVTTAEAAMAKLYASEMVGRVADRAVQVFGGAGYIADYGIERFYRDVRLFRLYEGTSEIQRLVIAREILKAGDA